MDEIVEGISIFVKELHWVKAPFPIREIDVGRSIDFKESQQLKAYIPISGIDVLFVEILKCSFLVDESDFLMETDVNDEQRENVKSPIEVTDTGSEIVVNELFPEKA